MPNLTTGCPATAVRFGSRLAPPDGQHLTGQKGLGQPLRTRPLAVYFFAVCRLRTAVCELRSAKSPSLPIVVLTIVILAIVILAIVVLVIVVLAVVIGVIPIPVVIAFGPFLFFVPFVEFVQDKACADG